MLSGLQDCCLKSEDETNILLSLEMFVSYKCAKCTEIKDIHENIFNSRFITVYCLSATAGIESELQPKAPMASFGTFIVDRSCWM